MVLKVQMYMDAVLMNCNQCMNSKHTHGLEFFNPRCQKIIKRTNESQIYISKNTGRSMVCNRCTIVGLGI